MPLMILLLAAGCRVRLSTCAVCQHLNAGAPCRGGLTIWKLRHCPRARDQ
ncbi:unnamed protein product [Staurois parvus]|uniref:Uncharacterized protein n=1 Tax=Staurois parvus TaxID=386267 RepID=A0ABN9AZB2_9NEOB|nr:unnamed protein product [Staurois parvus]